MNLVKAAATTLLACSLAWSYSHAQEQHAAPPTVPPAQQCVVISLDKIPVEKRREYQMLAEIGKALGRPMTCTECSGAGAKIITCNMACRPGTQC